jgi:hypothetical protein
MKKIHELRMVRMILLGFMIALFLSGLTAIPVDAELSFLLRYVPTPTGVEVWLERVLAAYMEVKANHPFLLYGYDWLAFAHFVLALLFIGPYRDPVRNIWVIRFGMIACVLVLPFAFIAGSFRGIPIGWQLIDCSFGVLGFIPLWICYKRLKSVEAREHQQTSFHHSTENILA